jgi:hypothetical protein
VTIDYDQHQVHESESWHYDFYVASLTSGSSKNIRLVVPNITVPSGIPVAARMPHLRYTVEAADRCDVFIYETPTFSTTGTQRTPINLDFNHSGTPQMTIWEDPTVTATGAQKERSGVITAAAGKAGGSAQGVNEFILKNNTEYLLRVTSGATPNIVLIDLHFYEDLGV